MADTSEGQKRTVSFGLETVEEDHESNSTLAALVASNPLADQRLAEIHPNTNRNRNRRRSSISIIQTLHSSPGIRPSNIRQRSVLVGARDHFPDDPQEDQAAKFEKGRLLTIMMATWNTGEAEDLYGQNMTPRDRETADLKEQLLQDMHDILFPRFIEFVSDLIIVCTQEMSATKDKTDWEVLLQEAIGPSHVPFHAVHYGTISLCVFLRRELIWYCTEPEENVIRFRAINGFRTKGSLAISFNIFGTSFLVINSHFEAGDDAEGRSSRRLNFYNTITQLQIPSEFIRRVIHPSQSMADLPNREDLHRSESTVSLDVVPTEFIDITKSSDCVFWGGDMNFRVDMPYKEVIDCCSEKHYDKILMQDEFHLLQKRSGSPFADFNEAKIDFPPTYKYDLSSGGDSYAKKRTPSYTDRILFRAKPIALLECTEYRSIDSIRQSDHKPVIAHFRMKLRAGLHSGSLCYGKFNWDVYKEGCERRALHHSFEDTQIPPKRRPANTKSAACIVL